MKKLLVSVVVLCLCVPVYAQSPLNRSEQLLLDIANLIIQRLTETPDPDPVPIPDPIPDPDPVPTPVPDPVVMENVLENAVKVTNGTELLTVLALKPASIALKQGLYDTGSTTVLINWECDIRGGYNDNWQRPVNMPSTKAVYDPLTGDVTLPKRLKDFLSTGIGETVITKSVWVTSEVGHGVWQQGKGRLDRVTFMGTRNSSTNQAIILICKERDTTRYQDVMTIQRFMNSHAYVATSVFGGEGMVVDNCIFYSPFAGRTGNCRPQFLIGFDDTPALEKHDQLVTLSNTTVLMPINGGYHRLNFIAGSIVLDHFQWISPNPSSYWSCSNARNVGLVEGSFPTVSNDDPTLPIPTISSHELALQLPAGVPDVQYVVNVKDSEFVCGSWLSAVARLRKLEMTNTKVLTKNGSLASTSEGVALWADRGIFIDASNTFSLEEGKSVFPDNTNNYQLTPAGCLTTRYPGKYVWSVVKEQNRLLRPVCLNGGFSSGTNACVLMPTVITRPYVPPKYEGILITSTELNNKLIAGGEIECVKQFDAQYPALINIP